MSSPSRIFETAQLLPRGPHALSREDVATSQRARLMAAVTELLAEGGYGKLTIGELARRAAVSRGAFYEHFESKEACLLAAYEHFALTLVGAMTSEIDEATPWSEFVSRALGGYLGTLEREPVAARAFIVEIDAAGETARARRRKAMHGFASLLAERHAEIRTLQPGLGELPERVHLGIVLGVRELVREALETQSEPRLTELAPDIELWITATIEGAAAAAAS